MRSGVLKCMASPEHLGIIAQGIDVWRDWRASNRSICPDLSGADLSGANLTGANLTGGHLIFSTANLSRADLSGANLSRVNLSGANLSGAHPIEANLTGANLSGADLFAAGLHGAHLSGANLSGANLSGAHLGGANLSGANLTGANLNGANLSGANLTGANLSGANLTGASFYETIFGNIDLGKTIGLDSCWHIGPSIIDFRTLSLSGNLPISFLRGCGLPESLIEYLPSFRGEALRFYSCFISYSKKDQLFADRLHADLQNAGVRCWFAPHDLPIGAKTWDAIDEAIKLRDKLLVVLSEASIGSDWVEDEVNKAYAEERDRKTTVLFPVRIDDVVMTTPEPWARKLRDQRNIGDFQQWENVTRYSKSLERLLRDLKTPTRK